MTQPELDFTGEQLRDQGLDRVMAAHPDFVRIMREEAAKIAYAKGRVTADDVRQRAAELDMVPRHHNAFGGIFRTGFRCLGHTQSKTPSCHARTIKVWGLA